MAPSNAAPRLFALMQEEVPLKHRNASSGARDEFKIRLSPDELKLLDGWIKAQPAPRLTRLEAIRRLVKQQLAPVQPQLKRSKKAASKARNLAGRELDRLTDASLPANERERRKRRLTKGPSEFRDIRADLPKAKD